MLSFDKLKLKRFEKKDFWWIFLLEWSKSNLSTSLNAPLMTDVFMINLQNWKKFQIFSNLFHFLHLYYLPTFLPQSYCKICPKGPKGSTEGPTGRLSDRAICDLPKIVIHITYCLILINEGSKGLEKISFDRYLYQKDLSLISQPPGSDPEKGCPYHTVK